MKKMKKKLYQMTDEENELTKIYMREVGVRLRKLREKLDVNQVKMAKVIRVSYSSYQKYEEGSGKIPIEKLIILCKKYDLFTADDLKGVKEEIIPLLGKKTEGEQKAVQQIMYNITQGRKVFDNIEKCCK